MHRTFIGDFQKPRALFRGQIAFEGDRALDVVDLAFFGFAFGAIFGVDFFVVQADLRRLEADPKLVATDVFGDFANIAHPYGLTACAPLS